MNQETRGGLHKKLEEVLNLADVETIKFINMFPQCKHGPSSSFRPRGFGLDD